MISKKNLIKCPLCRTNIKKIKPIFGLYFTKDSNCLICCSDNNKEPYRFSCNHVFCKPCVDKLIHNEIKYKSYSSKNSLCITNNTNLYYPPCLIIGEYIETQPYCCCGNPTQSWVLQKRYNGWFSSCLIPEEFYGKNQEKFSSYNEYYYHLNLEVPSKSLYKELLNLEKNTILKTTNCPTSNIDKYSVTFISSMYYIPPTSKCKLCNNKAHSWCINNNTNEWLLSCIKPLMSPSRGNKY
jgi:hypothetical protein